jgi:hypothetical protein
MSDPSRNDRRPVAALRIAAILCIAAAMVTIGYTAVHGCLAVRYLAVASEQDRLAQQLYDLSQTASAACPIPYAALRTARNGFGRIVSALSPHDGDPQDLPDAIQARIEAIEREWEGFGTALDAYLHTQSAMEAALDSARIIGNTLPHSIVNKPFLSFVFNGLFSC